MKKTMPTIVMAMLCLIFTTKAQQIINLTGKIITSIDSRPLSGATIKIKDEVGVLSDREGKFTIKTSSSKGLLIVSYTGYKTVEIPFNKTDAGPFNIILEEEESTLKEVEVISTGYQTLNREKTAGSFVQITNKELNRSVSTNILDRLKDIVPGMYFENRDPQLSTTVKYPNAKSSGITIRGQSTFNGSKEPLIILDNFPYEGEIKNINPNDIDNITILKDASSASIWGAKSGNGVIIITTKKGKLNQRMKIDFMSTVTLTNKPDLKYSTSFLDAKGYVEMEQYLFDKGFFNSQLNNTTSFPTVSPAVELMSKFKAATTDEQRTIISKQLDALKGNDVRNDYSKYIYQQGVNQQYALGLRGGTDKNTYSLSVGYDKNNNNLIGNGYNRLSINSLSTFRPVKNLELTAGINYSKNNTINNNDFAYGSYVLTGNPYLRLFPYAKLADDDGNPLAIPRGLRTSYLTSTQDKGFLDWNYVPINEIKLADNTTKVEDLLLRFGLKYQITPALSANLSVQNEKQIILGRNYRKEESYYVQNLINRFSVYDAATETFAYNFPKGAILELQNIDWMQNNARMQFNYDKNFEKHAISLLTGFELKELKTEGYTRASYGYDDQFGTSTNNLNYNNFYPTNPIGSDLITAPDGSIFGTLDRNVSYFAVGTYAYDDKYTVNLSARKDGANLFGAKANDKIQPFWSVGLGWNLSNERFFKVAWLSYLKLRTSFGYQGNTSTNSSSYLTGMYLPNDDGAPFIFINTAPNPRLQWESIQNINLGLDFSIKDARVSGSIEAYHKKSLNLIQATALPLQSGFSTYQANTGSVLTQGIEAVLNVKILPSGVIKWNSSLVFSGIKDRVLKYDAPRTSQSITTRTGEYAVNRPLDAMFSYNWAGLNPENGNPRGYLNGKISEDYLGIIANFDPDSLVYNGSRIPTVYGSFRNDFSFKNLNLSVNIAYRLGYVFRRSATSLNYTNILQSGQNEDYNLRWRKPGDERTTDVPSVIYPNNAVRNNFYQSSEVLIQRGDHVRLQDVKLSYSFPGLILRKLGFHDLKVFTYANNLPILWRMNKLKIDPSAIGGTGQSAYPNPFTISFGLTANL